MTSLHAVPDSTPEREPSDVPAGWRELRTMFTDALRIAGRSPNTIVNYRDGTEAFAKWLHAERAGMAVEDVSTAELRAFFVWLHDRGLKANTAVARHRALRALFAFLAAEEIIETDPMRKIPVPKVTEEKIPPVFTNAQIDALANACGSKKSFLGARDRALVLLISSAGLRASEALGLTTEDLHLDSDQPYVTVLGKGGKFRNASISPEAQLAIRLYLRKRNALRTARGDVVFVTRSGAKLTRNGLLAIVTNAAKRAGVDGVHVHALRHHATHHMLSRGMPEHDVARQLGHRDTKQLARYGAHGAEERARSSFFRTMEGGRQRNPTRQ